MTTESEAARMLRLAREARQTAGAKPMLLRTKILLGVGVVGWVTIVSFAVASNNAHDGGSREHSAVLPTAEARQSTPATSVINEVPQSPASIYAERVQTYWLPEVAAMPDAVPPEDEAVGKLMSAFDGMLMNIADGAKLNLNAKERASHEKLIGALARKQAKLFPDLRRRYAKALDAQMFRRDIRVTASGATLRLVGGPFVRNANIEDMETALAPTLMRFRFRRVEYRWNEQLGGITSYTLQSLPDSFVTE